jgi:PadR family transcriptional regulator, regulatory protein AphA
MSPMIKQPLAVEHALLGLLRERPMHAYEIHQRLVQAEALGLVWRLKQSQVYALLGRLEDSGYLVGIAEPPGAGPPKRTLRLTDAGRAAFEHWVTAPVEHGRDFRIEFLAKLFFAAQASQQAAEMLIEQQRDACRGWLAELHAQAEPLRAGRRYDWLVLRFRIGQIEAILSWLDASAAVLAASANEPPTVKV